MAVLVAGALALAACGSDTGDSPSSDTQPPLRQLDSPTSTLVSPGEVPLDFVAELVADAAARSGESEDALEVSLAESVTWSDGALGCPEPGVSYTQALVDGYRVVVQTSGGDIDYRTAATDYFVVCEQ